MTKLRDEEIESLTSTAAHRNVRGQRRALCAGAICFILGLSAIVCYTAVGLGPRADFVVSKEEEKSLFSYEEHSDHSFCYMAGRPPLQRANDMLELARRATLSYIHSTVTSLNQTAVQFPQHSARILKVSSTTSNLIGVTFEFQAMEKTGDPVTVGGGEFVLSLQAWTSGWSFKTSVYATDLNNGVYQATIILPRVRVEHFNATLMHYYTAYEGRLRTDALANIFGSIVGLSPVTSYIESGTNEWNRVRNADYCVIEENMEESDFTHIITFRDHTSH